MTRSHPLARSGAVLALVVTSLFSTVATAVTAGASISPLVARVTLEVRGTVTVLTPSLGTPTSVTIQPQNPAAPSENVPLGSHTDYRQSGAAVTVAALTLGVRVNIMLTGSPATAALVRILTPEPVFINGTVTALAPAQGSPTSMTIQPRDLQRPSVNVLVGPGTLFYAGGLPAAAATLVVGAQVELEATGAPATATVVEIEVPRPLHVDGVVTALSPLVAPTQMTIMPDGPRSLAVSIALSAKTIYRQSGSPVSAVDLVVGSRVDVLASGNPTTAAVVRIAVPRPLHLRGMVTGLSPSGGTPTSMTVQPQGFFRTPVSIALAAGTRYWQLKAPAALAALLVGSHVDLTAKGNPLTATVVHISAPWSDITIGSVTGVTAATVTLQPQADASSPVTFTLSNSTTYFAGREISTIAEVNVGDIVRVAAAPSSPTTAVFVTVRNMVIIGRVTGVAGTLISVTGFYGDALGVSVTPSTSYFLRGKMSNLREVLTGDMIVALGPAMSGVTDSVTATTLWIGPWDNPILHRARIQYQLFAERHHR